MKARKIILALAALAALGATAVPASAAVCVDAYLEVNGDVLVNEHQCPA